MIVRRERSFSVCIALIAKKLCEERQESFSFTCKNRNVKFLYEPEWNTVENPSSGLKYQATRHRYRGPTLETGRFYDSIKIQVE